MQTKTWFHGTDTVALEKIRKDGLKPDINKFNLESFFMENPAEWEEKGFVFVTPDKKSARNFAIFRADYDRAEMGKFFHSEYIDGVKLAGESHPIAKPIILQLELPEHINIEPDPHYPDKGFRVCGSISPEHIKRVIRIRTQAHAAGPTNGQNKA